MSPRQLSAREKSDSRVLFSVQHSDANLFESHYRFVYLFDYIVKMLKYYRKQLKIDALDWTSDKRRKSNSLSRQQNVVRLAWRMIQLYCAHCLWNKQQVMRIRRPAI